MKFSCSKQNLQDSISIASKAVTNLSNTAVLKGLLLEIIDSQLRMTGTDTDITIQSNIDINVDQPGSIVLDSRIFGDIVRNLPDDMVYINIDEKFNTEIICQNVKFKIKGLNPDEYPRPLIINQNENLIISGETLKNMIRQSTFAASTDELKPVLTGVLFEIEGETLTTVAVDGYRLALNKCTIINNGLDKSIVVPAKTLNEVAKLVDVNKDIKIYISNNNVQFELENANVYSRLLEGDFLNYKQIIQSDFNTDVRLNTKHFQAAIERAALLVSFKDTKSTPVKLNVLEDKILITAVSEIGEAYEEVPSVNEGKDLEIGFNPKYLLDELKVLSEEEIIMKFGSNISPCIITPISSDKFLYLILPIRLKN